MVKKGLYFVVAIFLAVLSIAALCLPFGRNFLQKRYVSRDVDGEVLSWNPANGELKVKIQRNSAVLTTTVPVNPPENAAYIRKIGNDEDGLEVAVSSELTGPGDEAWENAFCVGDVVRLTSREFDVTRVEIGETLRVDFVQKINDAICER